MAQDQGPQFRFEPQLRLEVDRVLGDVVFRRAPIQSRLLHYLMERTISDPTPPTQYEIAVDGLGKDSEYDIENDSYPRVQVSRLKRNLQNYYARNAPGNGLKVELFDGSYRLRLVPLEKSEKPAKGKDMPVPDGTESAETERRWLRAGMLLSAAIWVLGLIGLGVWYYGTTTPQAGLVAPKTALILNLDATEGNVEIPASVNQGVEQIGRLQLRNSFVSRPSMPLDNVDDAQYLVMISSGVQGNAPALFMTLLLPEGDVLYAHTINGASERTPNFESELETSLAYITSPTGAIAKNELHQIEDPTVSDYACFLSIENNRARASAMADLIDRCIERYPQSNYAAFWHARRAYSLYQADLINGEPIHKGGPAWAELSDALEMSPTNAYANFLAAKVEYAMGRCESAQIYVERALERAATYPAMVASAKTDGASCIASEEDRAETDRRLRALARYTPDRDTLLNLYLMLGMVAVDDRASAVELAETLAVIESEGSVQSTTELVRQALTDGSVARAKKEELRTAIRQYVWNKQLADEILNKLTA